MGWEFMNSKNLYKPSLSTSKLSFRSQASSGTQFEPQPSSKFLVLIEYETMNQNYNN